jgi:CHAT domain-containing protein/tetratricopeptide (TPR) repeat protein
MLLPIVLYAALLGSLAAEETPAAKDEAHARCPFSTPGLVVETVTPESAAFRAGLTPGDRLFSWCRAGGDGACITRGDLRTPFDWLNVQMEDVQWGGVVTDGTRGSESRRWNLLPTFQGLTVAPLFQGTLAEAYRASRDREQAGDLVSAEKEIERAVELADRGHCADAAVWLRVRAAQLHATALQWPEADAGYRDALAKARELGGAGAEAHLRMSWSEMLLRRGDLSRARQQLENALALEENDHPESLGVATVLARLGNVAEKQDDLEEAERQYRRVYGLVLGAAPGGGAEAASAVDLAVITGRRGDLAQAERYAARALALREKLTPMGDAIIPSLVVYGNLLYSRGDYAGAESAFLRARKILEKIQPESERLGTLLHNLGELAYERGDYEAAESSFQRELALFEKLDPSGRLARESLVGLGEVALRQQRGGRAQELWRRALALSEKLNPKGPKNAWCLRGLAEAARLQGRNAEAEKLLRQALAIWQEINPEAFETGSIHLSLGLLLFEQGNAEAAEAHLRTAIRLSEKDRRPFPEAYQALARLLARKGRAEESAATYLAAVGSLEAQRTRLGGAEESQWLYGSRLGHLHFEAAEHQIALGRPEEAWKLLERGRARGFQEMLAQRDLRFAAELPVALYTERRRLDAEYDRTQAAFAGWVPARGPAEREALDGRLRDLRLEQAQVQERIRRSSPHLGALESPAPLDVTAARSTLDPGTVLLTYSVGESRSYLFVIEAEGASGPGFFFYPLAIGREDLRKEIEAFRNLLSQPETLLSVVKQRGRHLYDVLVRPAEPALAKADRWLISPDGPLQILPFAALSTGEHYVAELKPVHHVASATVYKEIKATRPEKPSAAAMDLLAVGAPQYPAGLNPHAETDADPQVQSALRRGLRLEPLPATRSEVEEISKLFPHVRTLLGRDATEETIKSLAPQARRLHFACHGLLDERFPLNSALAFSIPEHPEEGRDNGLLQAWEIFESVRLDADLVTLSACDTGLGKEMGGEGLVGLVRAFQFAGARSVVASLWSVADVSTAMLMKRFYTYLRQGKTKDEALRAAQLDLIHSKRGELSRPYNWAGFALYGDWK